MAVLAHIENKKNQKQFSKKKEKKSTKKNRKVHWKLVKSQCE